MRECGIDIGSVSIKIAEFNEGNLVRVRYIPHYGSPYNLLFQLIKELKEIENIVITGSVPRAVVDSLGIMRVSEVEAIVKGLRYLDVDFQSVIEIGGISSKFISLKKGMIDFSSNSLCAAGAGIFLDQQAQRLFVPVEKIGEIALNSKRPARIAGRCAVFAKSDMIHLQQIGTPVEDLIAGLCYALARNFKGSIIKGRDIPKPVAFIGGVAANKGMVKALRDTLNLEKENLVIPDYHNAIGAIGAVICARDLGWSSRLRGMDDFQRWLNKPESILRLPPLDGRKNWSPSIIVNPPLVKTRAYLGIDIGSISTNLVLIDEQGNVIARKYLWTKGRPIDVVIQGLSELNEEIGEKVEIIGVGTTGSGRYLIGELVGADLIKNEISAQARAAIEIDPEVDTIFEIGGQDSKYIRIENKTIVDFEMNKVCAAGTGSFLEEQAQILGVKLEEFGDCALEAKAPINLGERCTVFIGAEVIHHQNNLAERENLLAGLGYSTVFNYLNRVVGNKKIGQHILFQGGVAANKAVVSAFEEVLKKKIIVPPNHDVTGAIGIALIVRDSGIKRTKFRGFELAKKSYKTDSFICKHCSNECEINCIRIEGEKPIFYGGRCERYEEKDKKAEVELPDIFQLRNAMFFRTEDSGGIPIGIPRALFYYELFPFFYKFLLKLGFKPVLSDETNRVIVENGTARAVADTCFPIKVGLGHIDALIKKGIKEIFIPSVITMKPNSPRFTRSFVCPYVQSFAYQAKAIFGEAIQIFTPVIYFDRGIDAVKDGLYEFAKRFGKKRREVDEAVLEGIKYLNDIQNNFLRKARDLIKDYKGTIFLICSRPYNGYDAGMNLKLIQKIRSLSILPIPMDIFPIDFESLTDEFFNMYWYYGQKILGSARMIAEHDNIYPVYLSNFACGPDSFLINFFREKLNGKPMLVLELDEHSGDAGFITRLEAFIDSIRGARYTVQPTRIRARSSLHNDRTIYIPDMCDGAKVLCSAMRYAGIDAKLLDTPDDESVLLGRKYTSGRECLPAIITTGDIIKKVQARDFNPEKASFFMAQGSGPCRFGQYYKLHRVILDKLGFENIPIYAPNQGPSLFDDLGPMGLRFLLSTWDGICAVDALEAKVRRIRPYELNKGETEDLYNNALKMLCARIEKGKSIIPLLKAIRRDFDNIRVEKIIKPRIGIVGEIYIRSQKFSNGFLEKKLESMDCEVALPSIGEWFFYTNFTRERNCIWFRQFRRAIFTKLFDRYMQWRQRYIYKILGLEPEPEIAHLLDLAKKYIHPSFEGEAILSVGKTIEFIKNGFCGVINVMPFTCMPGNIVTTIYKAIKDDYPEIPLLSLPFDGIANTLDELRLETFVTQAKLLSAGVKYTKRR
uniref:CoA activase n=1 Tax=candidate division WOR-3 bacterium TaxID=2052148 RepID=A0A7C4THL2_UNCW3